MNARRDFLKKISMAAGAGVGVGAGLYSLDSFSAGLTGFKALVVIHLGGGNDANDMIVPMDGAYSDYTKSRQTIVSSAAILAFCTCSVAINSSMLFRKSANASSVVEGTCSTVGNSSAL